MGMAGWCWDWPTQASIVPPVLGPDSSGKTWSTSNFSKYFVPATAAKITALASSTGAPATVDKQFSDLANQIQTTDWPLLPVQASLNPIARGIEDPERRRLDDLQPARSEHDRRRAVGEANPSATTIE